MIITNGKKFLEYLKTSPENFFVIHYSCQGLFENPDGLSPKITSIAIVNYSNEQTISFSTHAIAGELHIEREDVRDRFNEIELELLRQFYNFVRDHRSKFWVHWNMRNLTYGFEHLEHRYRVLRGEDAAVIPVERRINLNDMLASRYGGDYAQHPKMSSLMEINGGRHRHFLTGEGEVQAFDAHEFTSLHHSTLAKVGFFYSVMKKMSKGRLKTSSRGWGVMLDKMFESRTMKAIGFLGTLGSIISILLVSFS